jgi:DNA repair exonuclease SbcCD nuclease subunit
MNDPIEPEIVVVHSSDLHLDATERARELGSLTSVLSAADRVGADLLLLAGDVFDNNRVPLALIDRAARLLAGSGVPVLILPGNHDPLTADSVYRRGGLADPENVDVLGLTVESAIEFPEIDLEVWGHAHLDFRDMSPLKHPRERSRRWQIATAHGHWVQGREDLHRAWLIHDEEIAACQADYVALGHWDRPAIAGDGSVPAYYSGSPDFAGTVNVVRLGPAGVHVSREPLRSPSSG